MKKLNFAVQRYSILGKKWLFIDKNIAATEPNKDKQFEGNSEQFRAILEFRDMSDIWIQHIRSFPDSPKRITSRVNIMTSSGSSTNDQSSSPLHIIPQVSRYLQRRDRCLYPMPDDHTRAARKNLINGTKDVKYQISRYLSYPI